MQEALNCLLNSKMLRLGGMKLRFITKSFFVILLFSSVPDSLLAMPLPQSNCSLSLISVLRLWDSQVRETLSLFDLGQGEITLSKILEQKTTAADWDRFSLVENPNSSTARFEKVTRRGSTEVVDRGILEVSADGENVINTRFDKEISVRADLIYGDYKLHYHQGFLGIDSVDNILDDANIDEYRITQALAFSLDPRVLSSVFEVLSGKKRVDQYSHLLGVKFPSILDDFQPETLPNSSPTSKSVVLYSKKSNLHLTFLQSDPARPSRLQIIVQVNLGQSTKVRSQLTLTFEKIDLEALTRSEADYFQFQYQQARLLIDHYFGFFEDDPSKAEHISFVVKRSHHVQDETLVQVDLADDFLNAVLYRNPKNQRLDNPNTHPYRYFLMPQNVPEFMTIEGQKSRVIDIEDIDKAVEGFRGLVLKLENGATVRVKTVDQRVQFGENLWPLDHFVVEYNVNEWPSVRRN
jgi:hypothetical protein